MKEQVKEWIVDKNLTTDSFDSIMIGVIYNSGHSTLDDPDVRKWIETHPGEFREMLPPKLSDNQQVVLEWLKEEIQKRDDSPFTVTHRFFTEKLHKRLPKNIYFSYLRLNDEQQFQVLAAFAEWGLGQLNDD